MAATDPLAEPSKFRILERTFLTIFLFEMFVKMSAQGVMNFKLGYFSQAWNWLDFVVVASAIIEEVVAISGGEFAGLVVLRVVRVLRPLKTISSVPKLAAMIDTMLNSVVPMFKAMSLLLMFMYIMAVFGNNFFRGAIEFWTPEGSYMSFDNIFYALLSVMQFVTMENWTEGALYLLEGSYRCEGAPGDYKCYPEVRERERERERVR